jgi:serine/threonine protein kinase
MVGRDGQQLGAYRLIQLLEKSETAEIYLGEHTAFATLVALKILQVSLPQQNIPAFSREAQTLLGLIHPNIVRMLDFGVQDGTPFLAMEYVARGSLPQNYAPGTRLNPASVLSLVKQTANALHYAHDQNIIHGNVKPENILLGTDDEALLSDFGIASISHVRNTPHVPQPIPTTRSPYMAPEQLTGRPQPASDQYALAVIAYEYLEGSHPFQSNSSVLNDQQLQVSSTPPLQEISSEVATVLKIALESDPTRRFNSIQAFARALEVACNTMIAVAIIPDTTQKEAITNQLQEVDYAQPLPDPYPFQTKQNVPVKRTRRVFLAGATIGGVLIIGGVTVLFASGKLHTPFTKTTPQKTPNTSIATRPTATPTEITPTTTPTPLIGTLITTYAGQNNDVTGVCWSPTPTSRIVASCSQDGISAVWNATTGATTQTFPQSGPLSTLVWSPDGQYIASGGDDSTVKVWDATNGTLISTCTGHTQPIRGLAWAPDSQRVVSASQDHSAIVWNATTGSQLITFKGHSDYVWVAAWAPDGNSIATGSWDSTVQIWNPTTGVLILRYTAPQAVRALDWSPDSSSIASGGNDNSVQVWQAASGNVLTTYRGHSDHIETVQWSPDGQSIASASKDTTVQIWQATTANQIYTYMGHSQTVWTLAWSPDGQLIVSGSRDHTAKVWQAV